MSWEPRGQPFPSRWPQGCKKQTWQHNKDDGLLIVVFGSCLLSSKKVVKVGPPLTKLSGSGHVLHLCRVVMSVSWSDLLALMVFVLLFHMCLDPHQNLKRLLPLNMFKPTSIFTFLRWCFFSGSFFIIHGLRLSLLLYCHVCHLQPCDHQLGKGFLIALLCVMIPFYCVFRHFLIWCLGSDVVLDCIYSVVTFISAKGKTDGWVP